MHNDDTIDKINKIVSKNGKGIMKNMPYDIKTNKLIRALEKLGFEMEKTSGDHYKMKNHKGEIFPIPRHNITKTSTIKTNLKRLNIPVETFLTVFSSVILEDDNDFFWEPNDDSDKKDDQKDKKE